jgi:signal transduction histidine kinase
MALITDITERKKAEGQLQKLTAQMFNLQDEERRRLARELHDETAQNLAALNINLSAIRKMISPEDGAVLYLLEQSELMTKRSLREVRTLSYLLHPPMLDDGGLVSALQWFIDGFSARSGIAVDFIRSDEIGRLSAEIETALYRIVQEGLNNIHRHSGSPAARIELNKMSDKIILRISDEGRGLPDSGTGKTADEFHLSGVGITGMRERLRLLSGHLKIDSDEKGTMLTAVVPLKSNL